MIKDANIDKLRFLAGSVSRKCDRVAHVKTCPECNGDGVIEKGTDDEQQCPTCGGTGFVRDDDDNEEVTRTARRRYAR
jgi:DnaJ-class molecular chaperone